MVVEVQGEEVIPSRTTSFLITVCYNIGVTKQQSQLNIFTANLTKLGHTSGLVTGTSIQNQTLA